MLKRVRLTALFMSLLMMALMLAACGAKTEDPKPAAAPQTTPAPAETKAPASGPKVELVHWVFPLLGDAEEEKKFYEDLTKKFSAENPNITVRVEVLPWTGRQQKMLTELAAGAGPDIAYLNPDILATFQSMGILHELDAYLPADVKADYQPHTLETVKGPDGKIYAMPILQSVVTYFYNKDLFRQAGLDPEKPPTTWDEFEKALVALSKLPEVTPWYYSATNTLNMTYFAHLRQAGGDVLTPDGKVGFNSPEGKKTLDWIVRLYQEGLIPQDSVSNTGDTGFAAGKVGIVHAGNNYVVSLRKDAKFDWGFGPILKDAKQVTYGTVGSYGVFKKSKHPQEAIKWLTFLTNTENMKYINQKSGFYPVKSSALDIYKDDPVLSKLANELQYVRGDVFHPKARQIIEVLTPEIQAAMLGSKSTQQALEDAAKKTEAAFAQP